MSTELQRLADRRELLRIVARREREQAQALSAASGKDFPPLVCGQCGADLSSKTAVAPGVVPLCRACTARTPNTTETER